MPQCSATTKDGRACTAMALHGREQCFAHDPSARKRTAEGRRKGGRNRKVPPKALAESTPPLKLESVEDVRAALAATFNEVRTGVLSVPVGNALGQLGGQLLKALTQGDLEKRIAELEARAPRD